MSFKPIEQKICSKEAVCHQSNRNDEHMSTCEGSNAGSKTKNTIIHQKPNSIENQ
jgi:hypothetical protein